MAPERGLSETWTAPAGRSTLVPVVNACLRRLAFAGRPQMLHILGTDQQLCEPLSRRTFLAIGGLGAAAWGLGGRPARAAVPSIEPRHFGRAKRCILLFLTGGPPQHDTWDMKPQATDQIRGELKPIPTNVPGIEISELFPRLARQADKYCLIRSLTHGDTVHTSAGYAMLTGAVHPKANATTATDIQPTPDDHPHVGALIARHRGESKGVPVAVSLPEFIRDANVNDFPGQNAGFLGKAYAPLLVEADSGRTRILAPQLELPADMTVNRLRDRDLLRQRFNGFQRGLAEFARRDEFDTFHPRSLGLLSSPKFPRAFDLSDETAVLRESYGEHLFGQGCLLARRLIEAGVTLVTVYWHYEGPDDSPVWDTHWNNFKHLRERLMPPTDRAVSALLHDLDQRGLLEETLVLCFGEFGRTPRVNKMAGRDHWPQVQSIMAAGGGVRGGQVYGASDPQGAYPADKPVGPADLTATILHLLGVPREMEIHDLFGRPLQACAGAPIEGVLA